MLLSVGMIVKNEEKRLDRCLAALMPVISAIGGELVIADTGSADRTVETARNYTDRVYSFEWVKDFSAARNFTLEKSHGEWFMFIDADEVIINGEELVNFFVSGEYVNYNSASYIQRNYSDSGMKDYSDYTVQRIVRVTERTRFVNPVHEVIEPFEAPTKRLSMAVEHTGYIYTDERQRLEKFRRNTELLTARLNAESDPSPLLYLQLGQSFGLYDGDKAVEHFRKGLDKSRRTGDTAFFALYDELAAYYYRKNDWAGTAAVCRDYFRERDEMRPAEMATDAEMHGFLALALQYSEELSGAYDEHVSCRRLWRAADEGRLNTDDLRLACFYVIADSNRGAMRDSFLEVCIRLGKFSEAAQVLREVPQEKLRRTEAVFRAAVVRTAAEGGDVYGAFREWGRLCARLCDGGASDEALCAAAEAVGAIDNGDRRRCYAALVRLLRACPEMKRTAAAVRDRVESEAQKSEAAMLAAKVKDNIRRLAAAGNTAQAAELLEEFQGLAPDDGDIPELRVMVFGSK